MTFIRECTSKRTINKSAHILSTTGLVNSYNTTSEARDCRLDGKLDLATGREPVRLIMVYYLNELISFGVAGFRVDAASNIWPLVSAHTHTHTNYNI